MVDTSLPLNGCSRGAREDGAEAYTPYAAQADRPSNEGSNRLGVDSPRLAYLAYGRAGLECLKRLENSHYARASLFIVTHETDENLGFIEYLKQNKYSYTTQAIRSAELQTQLAEFKPDLIVSMHFRDLIPGKVLQLAPFGGVNLHPSLLPRYRGCLATMWAIINQEEQTGITYHYMDENFDTGLVILQKPIAIVPSETGSSLYEKAIDVAVENFIRVLDLILQERVKGQPQVGEGFYYSRHLPFAGKIDRSWSDAMVDAFIRAFLFPGKKGAMLETADGLKEVRSLAEYKRLLLELNPRV